MIEYLLNNPKISYEVAAIFFDLIILIFINISDNGSKTLRAFRFMTTAALLVTLSEVFAPLNALLPEGYWWGILRDYIEISQFAFEHAVMLGFALYLISLTGFKPPVFLKVINAVVLAYAFFVDMSTPFLGLIFYYDPLQHKYISGPLYLLGGYMPAIYFGLFSLIVYIVMFKDMLIRERYAVFFTIVMIFVESALQPTMHGKLKLVSLFTSLGVFILYLALETSDYQRLLSTQEKLMEAREEAASANRAKSVFIASMSHEIRTPMNALLGINEIILRNSKEENILNYSRDMKKAGTSLLSIINDVLDVSKMEAGQFTISEDNYHLDELVADLAQKMSEGVKNKKIDYQVRVMDGLPDELYGDVERLKQVLSNIIDNAIKYTKRGIVILEVAGENDLGYLHLDFSVTDTGVGIKKDDMDKLFKNFRRIDMENNRSIEGTGLGLSIAKQIITLMGGTIEVDSTYGEGSRFTVHITQKIVGDMTIEQHRESAVTEGSVLAPKIKLCAGKRILIVDDSETNLKIMSAFLQPSRAEIKTINDSSEAMGELAGIPYDLVFLDDLMPGLNGPAVLLRTRRMENNPNAATPMIIMSGAASKREKRDYKKMGFEAQLVKPIMEAELVELVNRLL